MSMTHVISKVHNESDFGNRVFLRMVFFKRGVDLSPKHRQSQVLIPVLVGSLVRRLSVWNWKTLHKSHTLSVRYLLHVLNRCFGLMKLRNDEAFFNVGLKSFKQEMFVELTPCTLAILLGKKKKKKKKCFSTVVHPKTFVRVFLNFFI